MAANGTHATKRTLCVAKEDGTVDHLVPVAVDSFGRLIVVGAGVSPSATVVQIADKDANTQRLHVGSDGRIYAELVNQNAQPLTDAQLRAVAVPVSGPFLTDTQLRAAAVPVTVSNPTANPETGLAKDVTLVQIRDRADFPWTTADRALITDLKRGISDARILMDYAGRADSLPVYVGKAPQATAESANTWSIQRLSYDLTNRLTDAQVLIGAWSNRTTLGWI